MNISSFLDIDDLRPGVTLNWFAPLNLTYAELHRNDERDSARLQQAEAFFATFRPK